MSLPEEDGLEVFDVLPLLSPPLGYRLYVGWWCPEQWGCTRHGDLPPFGRSAAHFNKLYTGSTTPAAKITKYRKKKTKKKNWDTLI